VYSHLPAFFIETMQSLNFNYHHPLFEKTIQLYGDRAGGQGNFEFAGLAELKDIQIVILIGNSDSLSQPADWRRFLRLINLAHRLNKPILLWNLSIMYVASNQHHTSLALGTVIHDTKLQLLRVPQPIISVCDENYMRVSVVEEELEWVDGKVIVKPDADNSIEVSEFNQENLRMVDRSTEISDEIIDLINILSNVEKEVLIANRLECLHRYAKKNSDFN